MRKDRDIGYFFDNAIGRGSGDGGYFLFFEAEKKDDIDNLFKDKHKFNSFSQTQQNVINKGYNYDSVNFKMLREKCGGMNFECAANCLGL